MVRKVLCSIALVAALIPFFDGSVAAQQTPKPAISDYFQTPPSPAVMAQGFQKPQRASARPPAYCRPCLFYGGDFDPSGPLADGLWNGSTLAGGGIYGEVLVPFTVPRDQVWFVTGLFTNNQSNVSEFDPQQATWSISKGVTDGSGGRMIAHGTARATVTPTGRSFLGIYTEYTVLVKTPTIVLLPGVYWLTVVPQCTNASDGACHSADYYLSDTEDDPPLNRYGPLEPYDLSYFNAPYFGFNYTPATSAVASGLDRFSAGVLGFAL